MHRLDLGATRRLTTYTKAIRVATRHARVGGVRHLTEGTPSSSSSSSSKRSGSTDPSSILPKREKSWLTRKVESSPAAKSVFLAVAKMLGYGSPRQLAGRRAFAWYEQVCAIRPDEDRGFWQNECRLPPTFQSWFTITNLHVWMLTVRLRALPKESGKHYIQGLIDHFFIDVEDRIRAVLQPSAKPTTPYTFESPFYVNPNAGKGKGRGSRAPDRLVTRQMKIFKEQWAGMGMAFDLGLVKGDMEMAGAVWRNLLGARGAQGIEHHTFRRSVNLVGGEVDKVDKVDVASEERRDDGSGVHDFGPEESELYVAYPELMLDLVRYVRRELVRLQELSDEDIMQGSVESLRFGRVRSPLHH